MPNDADLGNWPSVAPLFDLLEKELIACASSADLESWVVRSGELFAALDE